MLDGVTLNWIFPLKLSCGQGYSYIIVCVLFPFTGRVCAIINLMVSILHYCHRLSVIVIRNIESSDAYQ